MTGSRVLRFRTQNEAAAFTGERYLPHVLGPIRYEHFHRYLFATGLCAGSRVLDIACGEGYGSALLAEVAAHVVGVDIDRDVVASATRFYANTGRLEFRHGSATGIPADDHSFDVVVSFETLEHFTQHEQFMVELRRVLRPGGLLVISTPNRPVFSAPGAPPNEFHVRELDRAEFVAFLESGFEHHALYAQQPTAGSIMLAEAHAGAHMPEFWVEEKLDQFTLKNTLAAPVYFVALASDGVLPEPADNILEGGHSGGLHEVMRNEHVGALTVETVRLNEVVIERDRRIGELTEEAVRLNREIIDRNAEIGRLTEECVRLNGEILAQRNSAEDRSSGAGLESGGGTEKLASQEAPACPGAGDATGQPPTVRLAREGGPLSSSVFSSPPPEPAPAVESEPPAAFWDAENRALPDREVVGAGPPEPSVAPRAGIRRLARSAARAALRLVPAPLAGTIRRHAAARRLPDGDTQQAPVDKPAGWLIPEVLSRKGPFRKEGRAAVLQVVVDASRYPDQLGACLAAIGGAAGQQSIDVLVYGDALSSEARAAGARRLEGSGPFRLALLGEELQGDGPGWVLLLDAALLPDRRAFCALWEAVHIPDAVAFSVVVADIEHRVVTAGAAIGSDAALQENELPLESRFDLEPVRPVPAASPGAMLLRRDVVMRLSEFTAGLAFHGEEAAVAIGLEFASQGQRIWLQPASVFLRSRPGEAGTGASDWDRMRARWQLVDRFPRVFARASADALPVAADRRPLLLFLDAFLPRPDLDSGSLDAWWTLRLLCEFGYRVVFVAAFESHREARYIRQLAEIGVAVELPADIAEFHRIVMREARHAELVYVQRVSVAQHVFEPLRLNHSSVGLVFSAVDLHFLREERSALMARSSDGLRSALETRRAELRAVSMADAVVVVSRHEEALLNSLLPGVNVWRLALPRPAMRTGRDFLRRDGVLFVGGFDHAPNRDAVDWLVREIWPLVRRKLPAARLRIVGSRPPAGILALADPEQGVEVLGFVEDLEPVFDSCRLSVAPLRFGAGVKGKIASSLLFGVPCVASAVATEGMGLAAGRDALVGYDAQELAEQIVRLHEDQALWQSIADSGFDFAVQEFSLEAFKLRLREVLASVRRHDGPGSAAADPGPPGSRPAA